MSTPANDVLERVANKGRLQALWRTGLLDSDHEPAFDNLTRLAKDLLGVPVTLISLVDDIGIGSRALRG